MKVKSIIKHKKKASSILTTLFEVIIIMCLLGIFISLGPPVLAKLNINHLTKVLVETIETNGDCSDITINAVKNNVGVQMGLNPTSINIDIEVPDGFHYGASCASSPAHTAGQKKIQLRSTFTVTVKYPVEVSTFLPSLDGEMTTNIDVGKTLSGVSQVFWK